MHHLTAPLLLTINGLPLIFNDWRADVIGGLPVFLVLGENVLRGRRLERGAIPA